MAKAGGLPRTTRRRSVGMQNWQSETHGKKLAVMHRAREGVPQNYKEVVQWFSIAAGKGTKGPRPPLSRFLFSWRRLR